MTPQQLILQDRSVLESLALETVSPELYYELSNTIEEATDDDLYRIIASNGDYSRDRAWQFIQEGYTYADYIADEQIEQLPVLSAFEWRQLGGTK